MPQALTVKTDLALVKEGVDFVQSFVQSQQVEEGFVQVVDVDADGVTIDISNFTTLDAIFVYNRDLVTLVHAEYTNVQRSTSFAGDRITFNNAVPDSIDSLDSAFLTDGWRDGMFVCVTGSSLNDGVYLVTRAIAGALEMASTVFLTNETPTAAETITLDQHVRNRAPVGAREFHLVSGGTLYLPDELVLRTQRLKPVVQCEVWVFGS